MVTQEVIDLITKVGIGAGVLFVMFVIIVIISFILLIKIHLNLKKLVSLSSGLVKPEPKTETHKPDREEEKKPEEEVVPVIQPIETVQPPSQVVPIVPEIVSESEPKVELIE